MADSSVTCPHPTCRKVIVQTLAPHAGPQVCPHCGQPLAAILVADPYRTVAPPAPADRGSFRTGLPSTLDQPAMASTDDYPTAACSPEAEPIFLPPDHDIPPALGRFQLCRKLGAGAFGVVYLAYDP